MAEITSKDFFIDIEGSSLFVRKLTPVNTDFTKASVIFLHDSLGSAALWRKYPEIISLGSQREVYVYERRGHGSSSPLETHVRNSRYLEYEADLIPSILKELSVKEAVLYGHSDGASIALIAAGKFPALIKGLIVEAPHIFVEDITIEGVQRTVERKNETRIIDKLKKYHGEKAETTFRAWGETWLKPEYHSWNIESFLKNIASPVLVIQGEDDEYGTERQMTGISGLSKGRVELRLLPKMGHNPHNESPSTVSRMALEFLKDL
ncbi:MAG TPA: alpha/beta hydrolase [Ignavibacteriales bacterium]|nr:alpha/beta hydrolase [Ignavibacteriales bacterium]